MLNYGARSWTHWEVWDKGICYLLVSVLAWIVCLLSEDYAVFLLVANIETLHLGTEKWKRQSIDDWGFRFLFVVISILNLFTFHSLKSWNLHRYMWPLELSWACGLCHFIWCKAQWVTWWPFILYGSKVESIADYSHKISWIISGRCQWC